MRRVAASRVYINKKEFHNNHIVELFGNYVINHYSLHEELAMTEWLGGVIIFSPIPIEIETLKDIDCVCTFFEVINNNPSTRSPRSHAYHISNMDITNEQLTSSSVITLLEEQE